MAKVRIGFSTQFEVENETVGIGTDSALDTLHVTGDIIANGIDISGGITTVKTYEGFIDKEVKLTSGIDLDSKSHSLSGEIVIDGDVIVSSATTFNSGPENLTVTDSFTLPGMSDDKPTTGTMRFNENIASLEFYTGVEWRAMNSYVDMGNRGRVVIAGGSLASRSPVTTSFRMDYFNINTFGNSTYFGDMVIERRQTSCCGNSVRSQIWGGQGNPSNRTNIDYFNIASEGNSVDFGVMLGAAQTTQALSSSTRGISYGHGEPESNQIQYTELATLGNAVDWDGDCAIATRSGATWASPTRGMLAGGASKRKHIEYITIASKGTSGIEFGELVEGRRGLQGCSNSVRGLAMGGYDGSGSPYARSKTIDYVTIASTGNATYFGDLSNAVSSNACAASSIRGINAGGSLDSGAVNTIDYVLIATTGNTMDFGDLSEASWNQSAGVSDCHGGLGGF